MCVHGLGSLYKYWACVDIEWSVSMSSGHVCIWSGHCLYEQWACVDMGWAISMSCGHVYI